ncbi:MAG: aldehyde ferredoxin oxidoreductase N-terminal domain-containing protein [Bacillota bacterium]
MSKFLRINMTKVSALFEEVPERYLTLGGRGLTSRLVLDEVPATCDPLGPLNKIIIAPGLLSGTSAPSSGRFSVGGKSPLTGGIKESNAGGISSQKLACLGIKAVILEGKPGGNDWYCVRITPGGVEMFNANDLAGKGTYQVTAACRERYGSKVGVITIGQAGEMCMPGAGITNNDGEGNSSRYAGRGGLGAVMGSKRIKAIVVDSPGTFDVPVRNNEKFRAAAKRFSKMLLDNPIETGCALGVLMEAGVIAFGDGMAAIKALEEVGRGTPLGRVIGGGSAIAGKVYGVTRVPVVKGQGIPAYDPRSCKGNGVTYATSPMGADHTAGYAVSANILNVGGRVDPLLTDGQVDLSRNLQIATAAIDSTGLCLFVSFPMTDNPEGLPAVLDMISALYGIEMTADYFMAMGRQILGVEREFNRQAGFTGADDRLPEFFRMEKLPPHNTKFDVKDGDLDSLFNF